jgi:hypothetical protein
MIEFSLDQSQRFKIACWVYGENQNGIQPIITHKLVSDIEALPKPSIERRVEQYLGRVLRMAGGQLVYRCYCDDKGLMVASWATRYDAFAIAEHLERIGAIQREPSIPSDICVVTVESYIAYEKMKGAHRRSSQGFVAMWFEKRLSFAFEEEMRPAIEGAGYEALRIDRVEHVGKIDDEIIAQIRRSAFVVADFSGHRGGVYYEAGFAHGLGLPVFFTCHEKCMKTLHFDIRQYNTIVWRRPGSLKAALQNRILAVLGAGPNKPDAQPVHIT